MKVSLVKAAKDKRLLGATLNLRPKQIEILEGLEGSERWHLLALGRQVGKTTLTAMLAIHGCVFREDLDALIPRGRTRYALVACPGQAQSAEFVRVCEALVTASPALAAMASVSRDRIDFELPNGARSAIRALPANSRGVRGMSASLIVMDEMAHMADTAGPGSDARMLTALEPTTAIFGDAARLVCCSTPFGESGKFYELFTAAERGTLPSATATRGASWDFDPALDQAWREAKMAEVGPDEFRQEYAAEFVATGGSFFDLAGIDLLDGPAQPEDARRWVAGLDPAFHADLFGVALVGESIDEPGTLVLGTVAGLEPGRRLRSLDLRRGREDATLARVEEMLAPYVEHGLRVVTDQHQGDAVGGHFTRAGIPTKVRTITTSSQTSAFTSLRSRLTDGSLCLWRHEQLLEELRRVRAKDSETIHLPRYSGSHCDIASALALAAYELRSATGLPEGHASAGPSHLSEHADSLGGAPDAFRFGRRKGPLSVRDMKF